MKKYSVITLCALLSCAIVSPSLGHLISEPNPFGKHPSDPIEELPGFTREDILVIAASSDFNDGKLAIVNYQPAKTLAASKALWVKYTEEATVAPAGQFWTDYLALTENRRTEDKELASVIFVRKIEKALRKMLIAEGDFGGFYNAKKLYRLKQYMAQAMELWWKKSPEERATWLPVVRKMGWNLLAYQNALQSFNMLNYNSRWEKHKDSAAIATLPLTGPARAVSKLGGHLKLSGGSEQAQSHGTQDFMEQKRLNVSRKLKKLISLLKLKGKIPNDWTTSFKADPETCVQHDKQGKQGKFSLIELEPDETHPQKITMTTTHPFGRNSSGQSPIPGVSWRRLAEICATNKQLLHAQDFSSVIDWPSFFYYTMQDKGAANYQESLFGKFLKVYAPDTYLNVFHQKGVMGSDHADFTLKENIEKAHYDLIMGIILSLESPHKSYQKFSNRTSLTRLEARLLRILLELYKNPKRDALEQFPALRFALRNPRLPLNLKYAPFNLILTFNTRNTELAKAVINLIKLNHLNVASDEINRHDGWGAAAAVTKAPLAIATAAITMPTRIMERGFSTTHARRMRTAAAVKPKREQLTIKITNACDVLKHSPIQKEFYQRQAHKKTPYAAYRPTVEAKGVAPAIVKPRQKVKRGDGIQTVYSITLPDEATPLPQSSTTRAKAKLGKKKGIQEVYPIRVPRDPAETESSFVAREAEMVSAAAAA